MPFADYDDFDECVSDHSDKSDPEAYCAVIKRESEGKDALSDSELDALDEDPCQEGWTMVGTKTKNGQTVPNCVPEEDVPDANMSAHRILSNRSLAGPIERIENEDGSVTYTNIKILSRGVWTDSSSGTPTEYIPSNLSIAEDNTVNLMHDADNEVSEVGHIEADSDYIEDEDLYADVTLDMDNAASEYADENLQKTLETKGEKGFGGPSVEIPGEGLDIDNSGAYPSTADGVINGLGFVKQPAAKTTAFDQTAREQGVAMSEGQSTMVLERQRSLMDLDAVKQTMDRLGVDTEDMSDDELAEMAEEAHEGLMNAMDSDMATHDDEEEDEKDADMADDMDEEEEEEDTEMDIGAEMIDERFDELWNEIEEMKEAMMSADEVEETLSEAREELADAETAQELAKATEDIDKRLSELEEEPQEPKSLADDSSWEPTYEDDITADTSRWG